MSKKELVIKSVAAGVAISFGGISFLATGYPWLFPIGLFLVCFYGFTLFTGKIGYLKSDDVLLDPGLGKKKIVELLIMLVVNLLTAFLCGLLVRASGRSDILEAAMAVASKKLEANLLGVFILACACGALVFIGVDLFSRLGGNAIGTFGLWFATSVFVYCGFEHCIANSFYFGAGVLYFTSAVIGRIVDFLLINIVGNSIGAILMRKLIYLRRVKEG